MDGFDWIADDSALDVMIEELIATEAYALDTEFHRERTYYPTLALVQIGTPQRLALVDPLAVDVGPLRRVFASDALCVMHAGSQDLEILEDACGQVPAHIFDTQLAALFAGYRTTSLGNLVTDLLGVTLDKSSQLTDWTQRPLPDADQRYAAADVAHLLALKDVLTERLEETGRLGWAEEEIERLRAKDRSAPDPATLWWKLRGKSKLTGRARGVAQELAAWRNERGRDANRPPRTVLSDMAVLALAQRPAKSEGDLRRVRNLDLRRFKHTEELLAAIRRGVGLARDDLRLPPESQTAFPPSTPSSLYALPGFRSGRETRVSIRACWARVTTWRPSSSASRPD